MREHAYAERQDAFDAVYHLGMFGLCATVHESVCDDGVEGWVVWEVRVDELPAELTDAPRALRVAPSVEPDEHDAGQSSWWDRGGPGWWERD